MTDLDQRREIQEARTAFDGMESAEHRVEQFLVLRTVLEIHELFAELLEQLAPLHQEVLQDIVFGVCHSRVTNPAGPGGRRGSKVGGCAPA